MKIKLTQKAYADVMALPPQKHQRPKKPNIFFRTLLKLVSLPDLWAVKFKYTKIGTEEIRGKEPCLYLMNHSSFIDLEIAASVLYPRPFNIVTTTDAFVGKSWLMRQIGCIPTKKFVSDLGLIRDISHCIKEQGSSVVMFPEAGYSLDGTATTLPETLGRFCKMMGVPVIMIRTYGAFTRDPLYNGLQRRKVRVSADIKYLLSPDELKKKTSDEVNEIIAAEFDIDNFKWQKEKKVAVSESFRADFLHRVLYKCPHCQSEGKTLGKGVKLICRSCGTVYTMDEYGSLSNDEGDTRFDHVPDWFAWERECVKSEIERGEYGFEIPVRICMANDLKHVYYIGKGTLSHSAEGFRLVGAKGELDYTQNVQASYSICADYNFYEIGDMICVGNDKALYYCFPEDGEFPVAKVRLAAEELFKLYKSEKSRGKK